LAWHRGDMNGGSSHEGFGLIFEVIILTIFPQGKSSSIIVFKIHLLSTWYN
jgi:hypothetical protein